MKPGLNQNHIHGYIWQNPSNTEDLKVLIGKVCCYIVCYAESFGLVRNTKLVFHCMASNFVFYHSLINSEVFESWFVDMLHHLEEFCVIVMDNFPYHLRVVEEYPKSNLKVADVQ